MQHFLNAGLAVAVLLGSASAAAAAPSSQLLVLNQSESTIPEAARPPCSRTVKVKCTKRGLPAFSGRSSAFVAGGLALGATALALAIRGGAPISASP